LPCTFGEKIRLIQRPTKQKNVLKRAIRLPGNGGGVELGKNQNIGGKNALVHKNKNGSEKETFNMGKGKGAREKMK